MKMSHRQVSGLFIKTNNRVVLNRTFKNNKIQKWNQKMVLIMIHFWNKIHFQSNSRPNLIDVFRFDSFWK